MSGLAEIAEAAGVSQATVSRVLNRRPGVSDQTRRRVLDVLARRPYSPRGVTGHQRSGVLALLVPELSNPIFPALAEALETRAAQRGYSTVLCNTHSTSLREEEYVRVLVARGVEGMVFVSSESTDTRARHDHYRRLYDDGIRMVFVNGSLPTLPVPSVGVDEHVAGYLATTHLLELGHRRIGFVSGPSTSQPARRKQAGWEAALAEHDIEPSAALVARAPYGAAGGAAAVRKLLRSGGPTGVICSSDMMAIGALRECERLGVRVPDDLSIVGFDDIALAELVSPALTTLAQPIPQIARTAVDVLVDEVEAAPGTASTGEYARTFLPRLVERESTAPPAVRPKPSRVPPQRRTPRGRGHSSRQT